MNLLPAFTEPHTTAFGALYDSGDYAAALDKALAAAGYADLRAEQAKRRSAGDVVQVGIGLSSYVEITGGGGEAGAPNENATVEVHPDGSATILTGTSPHGQGHATVWAMLASEELGIDIDKITLKWGDTDLIPQGGGTGGSRSLQQGGVGGPAGVAGAHRRGPAACRRRAGGQPGRPGLRRRPQRVRRGRRPRRLGAAGQAGGDRAAVRAHRVYRRPARRSRSGPTWRSSR